MRKVISNVALAIFITVAVVTIAVLGLDLYLLLTDRPTVSDWVASHHCAAWLLFGLTLLGPPALLVHLLTYPRSLS